MKVLEVVCAVIQREQNYFIAKRGKGSAEGIWEFPGGKVELNETREAAAVREIKEELNLDVKVDRFLCTITDYQEHMELHVHAFLCHMLDPRKEPELSVHSEGIWVSSVDLDSYQFQEADKEIIDTVIQLEKRK